MRSVKVLIIDDEEEARFILRISLGRVGGMTVLEAANGRSGIEIAATSQPDLIILDLYMPGFDGRETFAALRADPRTASVPIVFLTGHARHDPLGDLEALGPRAVLRKPFDPLRLPDQLRELLS